MSASAPRVAIIGLGLMGGSLARDLGARSIPVLGFDRRPGIAEEALQQRALQRILGPELAGIEEADVIVLATPVDVAIGFLPRIVRLSRSTAVVTDVGSTKRSILEAAAAAGLASRFVGSHPLAGDQRSGWSAGRTGLYEGATVFVCPGDESSPDALAAVLGLWRSVAAEPRTMAAPEHDRMMSTISHLPQLASTALAIVLMEAGYRATDLGPGGRDMTRLAESSAEMWTAIARSNADHLLEDLDALEQALGRLRKLLETENPEGLREFFEAGRRLRQEPGRG